ncbi:MAG: DUF5057 domain-containing protein [Lachnospiraceae bacterium]|nr:DUF5057 domain-containing protein [Lachnospiraceae bacterium]
MAGKKIWNKKKTLKLCSALLIVVVLGSAYATRLKPFFASAKDTFPGVETVVDTKMNSGQPYKILEIIPDGATSEIGYLVDGAEPQFTQTRFDEYLTSLREAGDTTFVNNKAGREAYINDLVGKLTTAGLLAEDGSKPLSYTTYTEKYFPTEEEKNNLQYVDLSPENYEILSVAGNYVTNSYGTGYYNANVLTFTYQRDTLTPEGGNYYVEFSTVKKSDEAPYNQAYELKYDSVNSLNYYQTIDEGNMVAGRTYYYVSTFRFDDTSQDGIYVANINTEDPYKYTNGDGDYDFVPEVVAEGETGTAPTYEVPVGRIWYTGGITNNDWFMRKILCVGDSSDLPIEVTTVTESEIASLADVAQYDFIYIAGNCTYEKLWDSTLTDEAVTHTYGKTVSGTKVDCLDKIKEIYARIKTDSIPCMIDGSIVGAAVAGTSTTTDGSGNTVTVPAGYEQSDVYKLVIAAIQATLPENMDSLDYAAITATGSLNSFYNGNHTQYAQDNIFCVDTLDGAGNKQPFFEGLETIITAPASNDPFAPVRALVDSENTLRVEGQYLSTDIDRATVIQYIINFQNKRVFADKETLTVLDVEPAWGALYANNNANTTDSRILTRKKVSEWTGVDQANITIVHMATSEFIGKIEDMNVKYDMIYFGVGYNEDYMNRDSNGKTVYNDSLMNGLVYSHVGDVVIRNAFLEGILDTDYVDGLNTNFMYGTGDPTVDPSSKIVWGYRNQMKSDGTIKTARTTLTFTVNSTSGGNNLSKRISLGNVNTYRFSGNDITYSKMADLEQYLNARYPIVFADEFFKADASGNQVVNGDVVDNSSILYEFLDKYKGEVNVFKTNKSSSTTSAGTVISETISNPSDFGYYMNMPKISLIMYNPQDGSVPVDTGLSSGTRLTNANSYGNKVVYIDQSEANGSGIYTLCMKFQINSDIDSSTSTRYDVNLYMDLNADGRFVSNDEYTEEMSDITVWDGESGQELYTSDGRYQLTSGKDYIVKKEVSSDLLGVLTWKLEVSQNSNNYIRTSKIGYTVMPPTSISIPSTYTTRADMTNYVKNHTNAQIVKVLQINGTNNGSTGNWNLRDDSHMLQYCKEYVENEGVWFDIQTISTNDFKNTYYKQINNTDGTGYDMLVFGFQDSYPDINNSDALDAVDTFIQNDKSVLFTHDCTSMVNASNKNTYCADDTGESIFRLNNNTTWGATGTNPYQPIAYWGYYMNSRYRELLGMDRYGVTFNENLYAADEAVEKDLDMYRSYLLKQGQVLNLSEGKIDANGKIVTDGSGIETVTIGTIISKEDGGYTSRDTSGNNVKSSSTRTNRLVSAVLGDDKDIAYVPKSGRTQAYSEVQGYGYGALNFRYVANGSKTRAYNFIQVGMNKYNFRTGFTTATSDNGPAYGQVSYMRATQVNEGQITHYPYEIGEKINLQNTHYQYYMLNMDEDTDNDRSSDMVVWYCLASDWNDAQNPYNVSDNDVVNNYYIYSVGSVLYSGVGHNQVDSNHQEEKKLFFNTFVAAYRLGVRSPSVTVLESSSRASNKTDSVYIPVDTTIGTKYVTADNTVKFYYTVAEPNLVTSEKVITANYQLGTTQIPQSDPGDGSIYITTRAVSGETLSTDGTNVSGLVAGHVYEATIHNINSTAFGTLMDSNNGVAEITINVSSSFSYYGEKYGDGSGSNNDLITKASTTVKVRRATLFDLD